MEIDPMLENILVAESLKQISGERNTGKVPMQHNWCSAHWRLYFELLDYCGNEILKTIKRLFTSEELFYVSDRVKRFMEKKR